MAEHWLIISHDATNSGAPRMLLEVMRGIRSLRGADWSCDVLLGAHGLPGVGTLASEFAEFGRMRVVRSRWSGGSRFLRAFDRAVVAPARLSHWRREWRGARLDLIYASSVASWGPLRKLGDLRSPILTHVHELEYSMRRFSEPDAAAAMLDRTSHFLAVSHAVVEDLIARGAAPSRITRVPNFLAALPPLPDRAEARGVLCDRIGVKGDARLVVGCGHIDPVKGTDRFVELADHVRRQHSGRTAFVWIGAEVDRDFARRLRADVRGRGLEGAVHFAGPVADASVFLAAADVVTVVSRYESFSRVALEAAALGRPVLAFAAARGPADLLGSENLIDQETPAAMAAAVVDCLRNPDSATARGMALRETVRREFLAGRWIAEILSIADRLRHD